MQEKPRDPTAPTVPEDPRRAMAGPRAIADLAVRLTRRSFGRRGFTESSLIADWSAIVGSAIGGATMPLKIAFPRGERSGGTLHLKVVSGSMALQLQHQERLVVERINGHFGYNAVARLAMVQGPIKIPKARQAPPAPRLSPEQEQNLDAKLAQVEDAEVKGALAGLGRHLAARR